MKRYRCPFLGMLTENDREEIRAKKALFVDEDSAYTEWYNDRNQCTEQAEYVRFWCEEVGIPNGMTLDQMPRTGKGHIRPRGVDRSIIVKCPIHGEQVYEHYGHHITAIRY